MDHLNFSKIVFLNASCIPTTQILMQSANDIWQDGLGSSSGELGHNIMDHQLGVGAYALVNEHADKYYKGRKPGGFYIPRFRNLDGETADLNFIRGYGYQGAASRQNWRRAVSELSYGKEFKDDLVKPGPWVIGIGGFGECLPYHENKITLNYEHLDQWGLPTVDFDVAFKENEALMRKDIKEQAVAMLKAAGYENAMGFDDKTQYAPGLAIHEMGGARMGRDPKTSVLNRYNQIHSVKNVYVTDGACMTSSGTQNPSITYMALTARAVDYAHRQVNEGKL